MKIAFAVFDTKAAAYGMPMFLTNQNLAVRGFSDACRDPKSGLAQHPEDYALYEIGSYDENSGKLTDVSPAVHIISASAVVSVVKDLSMASKSVVDDLREKVTK